MTKWIRHEKKMRADHPVKLSEIFFSIGKNVIQHQCFAFASPIGQRIDRFRLPLPND